MHAVTGDADWKQRYLRALAERGGKENLSRLKIAEHGMRYWYPARHNWTFASSVGGLRGLWEMEDDPEVKAAFSQGLWNSLRKVGAQLSVL